MLCFSFPFIQWDKSGVFRAEVSDPSATDCDILIRIVAGLLLLLFFKTFIKLYNLEIIGMIHFLEVTKLIHKIIFFEELHEILWQ